MVCLSCTGTGERVCLSAEGFGNRHCFLEGIADRVSLLLWFDPTNYLNLCIKYTSKGPSIKDVANERGRNITVKPTAIGKNILQNFDNVFYGRSL